jgi:hypothetical protein
MSRVDAEIDVNTAAGCFLKRIVCGCVLLLCAAAVSSCSEAQDIARKYDNGYSVTARDVDDGISRLMLWHSVAGGNEQVAEFVVVSNSVVTFMPTIVQEGDCLPRSMDIRSVVSGKFALGWRKGDYFPFTIRTGSGTAAFKRILQDRAESDMTRDELATFAKHIMGVSTHVISVLEVETPCRFELIDAAIAELSRFSGGGISIVPATRCIPVRVPHRAAPDDVNDIKVDIHDL